MEVEQRGQALDTGGKWVVGGVERRVEFVARKVREGSRGGMV
jgi:hypothetical protein